MVENEDTSFPDQPLYWTGQRFEALKCFQTTDKQVALVEFEKACQFYQKYFIKKQADILLEMSDVGETIVTVNYKCFRTVRG